MTVAWHHQQRQDALCAYVLALSAIYSIPEMCTHFPAEEVKRLLVANQHLNCATAAQVGNQNLMGQYQVSNLLLIQVAHHCISMV